MPNIGTTEMSVPIMQKKTQCVQGFGFESGRVRDKAIAAKKLALSPSATCY